MQLNVEVLSSEISLTVEVGGTNVYQGGGSGGGSAGADGAPGAVWRVGSGAPSNGTGIDGDFYLNSANGDVYKRISAVYSVAANIKGATGAAGASGSAGAAGSTGATGANGVDGNTILSGAGAPSSGLGVNGNFYIDTTAHSIYGPKSAGAWPAGVSLVGPTGATGSTGAAGATGPAGSGATSISFATAVPLTTGSIAYMPQQTISSVLTFTHAASPVINSSVYLRVVADGVHAPDLTAYNEAISSAGYDNRNGILNVFQFFYDGVDFWYSVFQQVGAVAVDVVAPTASSSAVANASPTVVAITLSEAMDAAFTPAASAFAVSGHTVSAAAFGSSTVLNLTVSAAFVNGEAARTVAYTQPGTNNARDVAGNLLANFSGLAITNNVAAAPGTPAIGTAVAGNAQASVPFTAPGSNGGSAITSYTATSTPGSHTGTLSQAGSGTITVTGLTNGTAYTFTVHATNIVGNSSESASSNSITPASLTVPGTPTIGTATAGDTTASVPFTAPGSNGGATITSYTATSTPGSITGTLTQAGSGTISVTGLTDGTAYTFTVHATNSQGNSTESSASNSVTPASSGSPFTITSPEVGQVFPTSMSTFHKYFFWTSISTSGPTVVSINFALSESNSVAPTSAIGSGTTPQGVWESGSQYNTPTTQYIATNQMGMNSSIAVAKNFYMWIVIVDSNGATWNYCNTNAISIGDGNANLPSGV
jgi:hypothetical protein